MILYFFFYAFNYSLFVRKGYLLSPTYLLILFFFYLFLLVKIECYHLFCVQIVQLWLLEPFQVGGSVVSTSPHSFLSLPYFWYYKTFQACLFFSPTPAPNQPFLHWSLISFIGKWCLKGIIRALISKLICSRLLDFIF